MKLFLYGPPGSGKSAAGQRLAQNLGQPFFDLDAEVEASSGQSIPAIFAGLGEQAFRSLEQAALEHLINQREDCVLALGGGTLLPAATLASVHAAGRVICLSAKRDALLQRLSHANAKRPLLSGDLEGRLDVLLQSRAAHYASFSSQVDTSRYSVEEVAWKIQIEIGAYRLQGMGADYDVRVLPTGLDLVGPLLSRCGLAGPVALVSDDNVSALYAERVQRSLERSGYHTRLVVISPGEHNKNLASVERLWEGFLAAQLDRRSTVLALGGGVVTDLAGFASATFLRGLNWVVIPTSLIGMVDASLGGKTAFDLKQGKNLAGAFHAPRMVLAFADLLASLPEVELRCGLAEVVKHAVLADPQLFEECEKGWGSIQAKISTSEGLSGLISRAMAVKVQVLQEDPYEQGRREILNLGHTLGHAVEFASGYRIRHGEAVAVGLVAEAQIGEALGITQAGYAQTLAGVLSGFGLPVSIPAGLDQNTLQQSVQKDKKRRGHTLRLPLPVCTGEILEGYEIEEDMIWPLLWSCMDRT